MEFLLDSHVFLWWENHDPKLGRNAKAAIADPANKVYVSAATVWEVEIKRALGKLSVTGDFVAAITRSRFERLSITVEHAAKAAQLPPHHHDPFDRMLVAQAASENLVLMTGDARMQPYGIALFPAG